MEQKDEQSGREGPRAWNDNRERSPVAPAKTGVVTEAARFSERLREARPSKKIVSGLMVAAAVLTMIVGFNWGGWVTGGTAQKRIDAEAHLAVTSRLVPICVTQFNLDPQSASKLTELKAITSSYARPNYVKDQGWATMPGEDLPDDAVAKACAEFLIAN